MQPSYSLYPYYANAILARDAIFAGLLVLALITLANLAIFSHWQPRVMYIARIIGVGGFYASLALAYLLIH